MNKMDENTKYIPGVCNIDAKGRKMRLNFGLITIFVTIAISAYLTLGTFVSAYWQIVLILPLFMGFIGLWQSKFSFCVADAAKHQYEIGGKVGKVINDAAIAKDKRKAVKIYKYATMSAVFSAIILIIVNLLIKSLRYGA
jgi:hypothetical protein